MIELTLPRAHELSGDAGSGCLVAVDAGATKTRAMAYDLATKETSVAVSGSGNQDAVGADQAVANIAQAASEAAGDRPIRALLLALAGTDPLAVQEGIEQRFRGAEYVDIVNDVIGAWGSAFGGEDGFALISGTGSHGVGVVDGRAVRVGGWGHIFGDEGSAFALGRAAVTACLYELDGRGPATALSALLAESSGVAIGDLPPHLYASQNLKSETAAYARLVDRAAVEGDEVARGIIERGGRGLAEHVITLAGELPVSDGFQVGLVGSTWKSEALLDAFHAALADQGGVVATVRATPVEREPVEGVLALLLRAVGRTADVRSLGW
ncbi:MAG: BadF/BadG/BcrA/BcrD ATPase family protein [Solirubrobacteraceae bacterium]|nr:BadF/BadG/BcrA/BcrD ATPase family protein [Patulibacter sp.]